MIHFDNEGLIPVEGFTILGINVKTGDNPIGHFGTGLKIGIAAILRYRGAICIHRGNDVYEFLVKETVVRGKAFEIVCASVNGGEKLLELGFTTELGKNWEAWMIMREFESNCRDEGGSSGHGAGRPGVGKTSIWISCPAVEEAYLNRDKYFLCSEPIYRHKEFEVHKGTNSDFFYRGIKVGNFPKALPFTFNFLKPSLQQRLTEDRTLSYVWVANSLASGIPEIANQNIQDELFTTEYYTEKFTYDLDYDQDYNYPAEEFWQRILDNYRKNILSVPHSMFQLMLKHNKISHDEMRKVDPFDEVEEQMVAIARQYITDMGYEGDKYKIKKAHLGTDIHGMADVAFQTILISPNAFTFGTKYICSTVFEEYLHLFYGFADCSRPMQSYLFEKLATAMEKYYYKRPL